MFGTNCPFEAGEMFLAKAIVFFMLITMLLCVVCKKRLP